MLTCVGVMMQLSMIIRNLLDKDTFEPSQVGSIFTSFIHFINLNLSKRQKPTFTHFSTTNASPTFCRLLKSQFSVRSNNGMLFFVYFIQSSLSWRCWVRASGSNSQCSVQLCSQPHISFTQLCYSPRRHPPHHTVARGNKPCSHTRLDVKTIIVYPEFDDYQAWFTLSALL